MERQINEPGGGADSDRPTVADAAAGNRAISHSLIPEGWSRSRAKHSPEHKQSMAANFVAHDLFVPTGSGPHHTREDVATIIVGPGTTPNVVVKTILEWIEGQIKDNRNEASPYHITWYTPGSLVPATLMRFRENSLYLRSSCRLYLFPGEVDPDIESVIGNEAVRFAEELDVCFTYSLLSAHAFDMRTGVFRFHFDAEVKLQHACARREAAHKFLFLDPTKFKREGYRAYTLRDLLETSQAVTIYSVTSEKDAVLELQFKELAGELLDLDRTPNQATADSLASQSHSSLAESKSLRLVIVGKDGDGKNTLRYAGALRPDPREN